MVDPWVAGALAIHVTLALFTAGLKRGFTQLPEGVGYEYELILLAALLAVALAGGGA